MGIGRFTRVLISKDVSDLPNGGQWHEPGPCRGLLVAPPVILAAVCFRYEYEYDGLLWPLGPLLFLGGWAVRIWAQQHVGYRLKTPRDLTTSGPYAMVRNPIYIGNTLIVLGVIVLSEFVWLVPLTVLWCTGVYSVVIRYEERQLLRK
jgi:protein-S-isoprenylcysteine O-methyltransferase Ste14